MAILTLKKQHIMYLSSSNMVYLISGKNILKYLHSAERTANRIRKPAVHMK